MKKHLSAGFVICQLMIGTVLAGGEEPSVVEIRKMAFNPQNMTITAGSTVKWMNREKRQYHSVWFEAEGLPIPDYFFPDESWERTFDVSGTYPYRCEPHPEMTGTITVK